MREELFRNCTLCPRKCNVNRLEGKRGYCGMDSTIRAARAALHMWEEPCISGKKGSGAVFFSGWASWLAGLGELDVKYFSWSTVPFP